MAKSVEYRRGTMAGLIVGGCLTAFLGVFGAVAIVIALIFISPLFD